MACRRDIHLSQSWRLGILRSRHQVIQFWWQPFSRIADGCLLTMSLWSRKRDVEKELSSVSFYKNNNPLLGTPPCWPHLSEIIYHRLSPSTIKLGVRASTHQFGQHKFTPWHSWSSVFCERRWLMFLRHMMILLEWRYALLMTTLMTQLQTGAVATETVWPTKLKLFTVVLYRTKFADHWHRVENN